MTKALSNQRSASTRHALDWDAINWQKVECEVRATQIRIAKATQEGNWPRVKALQRFLVHSFAARALAVKRVTENQGKRTPGVDNEVWENKIQKVEAIARLKQQRVTALIP